MPAISDQHDEIKSAAERLHAAKSDWITFYREILGLRGMIRRHFATMDEMARLRADRRLPRDPADVGGPAAAAPARRTRRPRTSSTRWARRRRSSPCGFPRACTTP